MAAQAQSQPTSVLGSSNVAKIFQSLTAKEPSSTCQPNPHQEALATKAVKTSKLAISKTTNTMTDEHKTSFSTHHQVSGQMFHVSSVAIVTSGLNANGNLLGDTLPQSPAEKRRFIQQLEDHSCYIQRPIQINTTWTHEEWEWSTTDNPQPDWQLLIPGGHGKLELCGAVHPNGVVLAHFKGHQKASVTDSNLWLVMQNPVPKHIFQSWKIAPDIVGTDIEAISDEDSDDNDNDIADLSSSIVDLKIGIVAETGKRAQPITILSLPNAKEVVDKDDKDALLPPNPWLSTFEQFAMGREDNVSDFDL
ncbi:hypothetical protein J3A83DRAFT_4372628 [Scleroderma citrinum]